MTSSSAGGLESIVSIQIWRPVFSSKWITRQNETVEFSTSETIGSNIICPKESSNGTSTICGIENLLPGFNAREVKLSYLTGKFKLISHVYVDTCSHLKANGCFSLQATNVLIGQLLSLTVNIRS